MSHTHLCAVCNRPAECLGELERVTDESGLVHSECPDWRDHGDYRQEVRCEAHERHEPCCECGEWFDDDSSVWCANCRSPHTNVIPFDQAWPARPVRWC